MRKIDCFLEKIGGERKKRITLTFNAFEIPCKSDFYPYMRGIVLAFLDKWKARMAKEKMECGGGLINTFHAIIFEAIKNASDHGSNCDPEKEIEVTLWAGGRGILVGIKDEGSFYKDAGIKTKVEGKMFPATIWKQKHADNCGIGMKMIYQADELFVDAEVGILYLLLLFDHKIWEVQEKEV
jgi:anti-sigma regulatory factor (Ser/Thr protein kinase)